MTGVAASPIPASHPLPPPRTRVNLPAQNKDKKRRRSHKAPRGTTATAPCSILPPILHHPSPPHHSTAAPIMSASSSAARHLVRRTIQAHVATTPLAPVRPVLRRRPRPFSTAVHTPPPAPPGGSIADAPAEAAKEGPWAWRVRITYWLWDILSKFSR